MTTIQTYFTDKPLNFEFWQLEDGQDVLEVHDNFISIIVIGKDLKIDDSILLMKFVNEVEYDLGPQCLQYIHSWNTIHDSVEKYFEGRDVVID